MLTKAYTRYTGLIRQVPAKPPAPLSERKLHAINTELNSLHDELMAAFVGISVQGLDREKEAETTRTCVIVRISGSSGRPGCSISMDVSHRPGVEYSLVKNRYVLELETKSGPCINSGVYGRSFVGNRPLWEIYCSVETDSILFFAGDTVIVTGTMSHFDRKGNYGWVSHIRSIWFHSPKQAASYKPAQRDRLTRRLQEFSDSVKRDRDLKEAEREFEASNRIAEIKNLYLVPTPLQRKIPKNFSQSFLLSVSPLGKVDLVSNCELGSKGPPFEEFNVWLREFRFRPAIKDNEYAQSFATVSISTDSRGALNVSVRPEKSIPDVDTALVRLPSFSMTQVDIAARAESSMSPQLPRLPDVLRRQFLKGEVLARFVVKWDGSVDKNSILFLKSDHALMSCEVRRILLATKFVPARKDNNPVNMVLEQMFILRQ